MQEMHEQKMHFLHEYHRQQIHAKDHEIDARDQQISAQEAERRALEAEQRAQRLAEMFDSKVKGGTTSVQSEQRRGNGADGQKGDQETESWKLMREARQAGAGYGVGEKEA